MRCSASAFGALVCAAIILLVPSGRLLAQTGKPQASYSNEQLADSGIRLEGALRTSTKPGNRNAAAWLKLANSLADKNNYFGATEAFAAAAVAAPRDPRAWIGYATVQLDSLPTDSTQAMEQRQRANAAAYLAYQRATGAGDKAAALAIVGEAFGGEEEWRSALNAYRASLSIVDDPEVRGIYEEMREAHGFRIARTNVDAEAASPRICVYFSEPLDTRSGDLSSYVALGGGASGLSVTAEDQQLCIDGVRHGERYAFTVRAGLPSTVGETLEKPAEFSMFVRDRNPAVRFTGRNYVLPRTGQRGIPLVSTNTDTVKVDIYRIGDRSLAPAIVSEDFERQLEEFELSTLGDEKGTQIWTGELSVEREQNKEVTTAFPVETTIGAAAPGVYVMVAQPKTTATKNDDEWAPKATQWFIISDLGLTALMDEEGLFVILRSLASAQPIANAAVNLVAKNNEILASAKSDAEGFVRFPAGAVRGRGGSSPALLTAETGDKDYAFLDLTQPGFDLTDRGVAGRDAPGPIDAFVFTERGVYRPGETVNATVLVRDQKADALAGVPLTLRFERPDGVEYRSMVVGDQGLGGRTVALPISASAMTGTWRLRVLADPKRPPVGEAKFLVEDYVPDRIEVEAEAGAPVLARTGDTPVMVTGRFLYGAPAAGLAVDGDIVVSVAEDAPGLLKGYRIGVKDDEVTATRGDLPPAVLDDAGKAILAVPAPAFPDTDQPLQAEITARVTEGGGRAVSRSFTLPVARGGPVIGVKPLFDGKVPDGQLARFDVVLAAPDGKFMDQPGLSWTLQKVETKFQWFSEGGRWRSETYETLTRVAAGSLDLRSGAPGRIETPVSYGRYRLDLRAAAPPLTSISFDAGWYSVASADTPDQLRLVLDKASYLPGDTATVTLEPRFAGRATVLVVGDKVHAAQVVELDGKPTEVKLPVDGAWGAGAYVVAFMHRPLDVEAGRMPGRAVGLAWISLDRTPRTIGVSLSPPEQMQPPGVLEVPLRLANLAPGEEAYVTVAAVDVGILNLTRYKAPAPEDWYYAQRKLGTEVRDLYGQLIDGMRATAGTVRSGGDGGEESMFGSPPADAPLALFSGIVRAGEDGRVNVAFDIPPFNGTLRVMAVAWSRDKVGHAEADVIVRDPIVLTATLPRFLAAGDRSTFRLDLDNVDGPPGTYALDVALHGPFTALPTDLSQKLELASKTRTAATVTLTASGVGAGEIGVTLVGPDGKSYARRYILPIRPSLPEIARRNVTQLAARTGSIALSSDLLADFVPGSGRVTLSVTPNSSLDVPALLGALDRYPYGCSEQVTSRAMPLLYVNELAAGASLPIDLDIDGRVNDAIERVLARQSSSGAFGLWSVEDSDDLWLDAYITDFLTRAREKGFQVPDLALTQALDNLKNSLSYEIDQLAESDGSEVAYALYVLARNGRAPLGDLRYLSEEKIDEFTTALGRAQLGAALALLGDNNRAREIFQKAREAFPLEKEDEERDDYGSVLRDRAAMVTLVSESRADPALMPGLLSGLSADRQKRRRLSTQENAWLVLAARALAEEQARMTLLLDGAPHKGVLQQTYDAAAIAAGVTVKNLGDSPLPAVVTATGSPIVPEPAADEGFSVTRKYYALDGTEVVPDKVQQTKRLVVVLTVTEPEPQYGQVLLVDRLPAGFEIDNPHIVNGASLKAFAWLPKGEEAEEPSHTEFRDDRFVAAYERSSESKPTFTAAYMVRAVSPGRYVRPPATVEDMYRPERFGRTAAGAIEITAP